MKTSPAGSRSHRAWLLALNVALLGNGLVIVPVFARPAAAAPVSGLYRELRSYEGSDLGVKEIGGVTFDSVRGRLVLADRSVGSAVSLDATNDPTSEGGLDAIADARTLSVEPSSGRLVAVSGPDLVDRDRDGRRGRKPLQKALEGLVGAEFDRRTGQWVSLVKGGNELEIFAVAPDTSGVTSVTVRLPPGTAGTAVATNPTDGLIYVFGKEIIAIDALGEVQKTFELDSKTLRRPADMVFAPSADLTDVPTLQSLFVVDESGAGGTSLVELALPEARSAVSGNATLVATRALSSLSPPSPDSAGIAYLPGEDRFYISDSEVDEMSIFQNVNLFEVTRSGVLTDTGVSQPWSNEPTGAGFDPNTNRLVISDDDANRITFVSPGGDGRHGTGDDSISFFNVNSTGNGDAEDVAFDTVRQQVLVVDGVNREVYRYTPTGSFLGQFDIGVFGPTDPEGIAYDASEDRYIVVDHGSDAIYELDPTGALLATVDISAANAIKAAGVEIAPASNGSGNGHYYIVDRGVDNDSNPNENDGRMYEMIPPGGGGPLNQAPQVNAGSDTSVTLPASATLVGTASDDGLPSNTLTTTWSRISGPGAATFSAPNALTTNVSFASPGSYVLRLTASDGALSAFDEVQVTVTSAGGTNTVDVAIATGSDDVEQNLTTNAVNLTNGDLELGVDGTVAQLVGLRFPGLSVPQGATITNAYVQFTADEVPNTGAALLVQAQAADNAAAFAATTGNVSNRTRTSAQVSWNPPVWTVIGQAGIAERTPNIAGVVQEVVSRGGWSSGNAMVLVVSGTGRRVAEAFEGGAALAPRLHVEYTTGGGPVNQAPVVSAGADLSVTLPALGSLSGSVVDDGLPSNTLSSLWSQVSGPGAASFTNASAPSSSVSFTVPGTYVLRLTGNDGAVSASDDVQVTVSGGGGSFVLDVGIVAGNNDAEEFVSTAVPDLSSGDLELGFDRTNAQLVGLRFAGLALPPGAVITNAWVQFTADEVSNAATSLVIQGENVNSSGPFTTAVGNLSARARTAASVPWVPVAWPTIGAAGVGQRTPSVAPIIQEIVSRPGWLSGNALTLFVSGTGRRTAEAANSGVALAPQLHIEYTLA